MEDLFDDTESEPHHFIVLDSQDTENIPPSWDDSSILKSLPALRIPETQHGFELTTIPATPLSPIHNFNISETHLLNSELVDSCSFNLLKLRREIMDDQHIVIDETCSQSSTTSDSSENFARSLNRSMIENPKLLASPKSSKEKIMSEKESKDSSDTKSDQEIPSTSHSRNIPEETDLKVLTRQSLFKNYLEDTENEERATSPIVCTPSTHIGSLQFSQESMLVPDTADEMNYIEPSPEYNPTPSIIPDSPTLGMSEESEDDTQDPTMIEATLMKKKKSENLDTTVEPAADESIKESQNFQLFYMDTQASQMSQAGRSVSQAARCISPEKPMSSKEPKKEAKHSFHDNSDIMSESQDFNLHLSCNTQAESCKDAASQRSSFSGKLNISQSPATPKDRSLEEVKFKLILPTNVHSPSKTNLDASSSTSHKSDLDTSQQDISQGMSSLQYKIKSQEKMTDPKAVQSQEGLLVITGSSDMLPDSQKKDPNVVLHKVGSQDVERGSQKKDSQKIIPSSLKEDSLPGSQKGYSPNVAHTSQKGDSQKIIPSSVNEDLLTGSQKVFSQNVGPGSQTRDSPAGSQKGFSQNVVSGSQTRDSPAGSQKGFSQNVTPSSQTRDSLTGSQKGFSQNVTPGSQKRDSPAGSQKGFSQNVTPSSQTRDSLTGSQKGFSQNVIPGSQKRDSPAGSQKGSSQNVAPRSQTQASLTGSQKALSQDVTPGSQTRDSSAGSQKGFSQNVTPDSQRRDSPAGSQKGSSQNVVPRSQTQASLTGSQKGLSQNVAPSSQTKDSLTGSQKAFSQNMGRGSQKRDSPAGSQKCSSQNVATSSQTQDSLTGSQKGLSQNTGHGSQKRDSLTGSQKDFSQNVAHSSQKRDFSAGSEKDSQNMNTSSQKKDLPLESQRVYSQGKNSQEIPEILPEPQDQNLASGYAEKSSESKLLGSQKKDMSPQDSEDNSSNTFPGLKKRDSQDVIVVGSQKESSSDLHGSQVVFRGEQKGTPGISQRGNSQGISTGSQKKNTQEMLSHSQNRDSQKIITLSKREQLPGTSTNSQKDNSQSISSLVPRELSQTGSLRVLSQRDDSPDIESNSQRSMTRSQKGDSQDIVRNPLDISAEFQKKDSQSLILRKRNSQDMSISSQENLSEKENSSGMSAHSEKEDSQRTCPDSQKKHVSASQEKNAHFQAGSQGRHILPHSSHREKFLDLSAGSREIRSQPSVSQSVEIQAMPKAHSQSRISSMDSSNISVAEIRRDSLKKDKKSIRFSSQTFSHSQPKVESHKLSRQDMKQYSSSQDSGLPHLINIEPFVSPPKRATCIPERPSTTAIQDSSSPLVLTEEIASVDVQNLKQSPNKITAIPLGSVSDFQLVSSLPERQDSCLSEPATLLSQERELGSKRQMISTSQPLPLKQKPSERMYQIKTDICKKYGSEGDLSAKLENREESQLSVSHELSSLKISSLPRTASQESEKGRFNDEETSQKDASLEKMEVDFESVELPSKPNICYLKDSQHSQGSSTITLSQFDLCSSQMEAAHELDKNSKEVPLPQDEVNLVSNPNHEHSENLTLIKTRVVSDLPDASSTMYPSQTSASQQRHTPSLEVQSRGTVTSSVAKYNIASVQPATKTDQPVAGPSNDPYLFVGSQPPKMIQAVESRKKQRRSKVLSRFTQKRVQKKPLPKKKSSLGGRNWTIRKDYKSPVHRVKFEPTRRRTASIKLLKDDPIFLKVPSYKDIETIFCKDANLKEQVKSSCSSDGSSQIPTSKEYQRHQTLFSNLQNVLQRKIVEETVVQLVYRKTTIETVKNSKVVNSRTIVEKDEPSIIRTSRNEDFKYLNSTKGVSPFCSPNSLTSGEYADVSSLSHSDSKTSNSSSFGSMITKQSTFEVPMSPLVRHSDSQSKKDSLCGPQSGGQPGPLRQLQSPGTDDDLLKAPSPITSVYKDAHSVYCSTEELHSVNRSCEDGRSYVTEMVPILEASSCDPAKSRGTVVQNSDSLFSSAENLNLSDSGPPALIAEQEAVTEVTQLRKEGQRSVEGLMQEPDLSTTLHIGSSESSENDLTTPPASQKWSSPQKRKASHSEENFRENSDEMRIEKPPPPKRLRKESGDGSLQQTKTSEEGGSPEISLQNFQQQIKMPSLSPESPKTSKSGIGVKVMAKWKDGYFYPGVTSSQEKGGKCLIDFADGDQLWVKINQILIVNYLPQGQSVMVQSKDNFFDSGMIVDHVDVDSGSADSFVYRIEMDDNNKTVSCTRQQVILTEDQAAVLLSDEEYQMTSGMPSTPQPSGADVSLDNLVEGSRRSSRKTEISSEKMGSRSGKRTKLMRMEPQAMSTPTPKRKTKSFKKGFMAHLNLVPTAEPWSSELCHSQCPENLIGAAVSSPKCQRFPKNPHVKKELFDAVKGPLPKQKNLFKGMNFLLTHTEKTSEQKLLDKKMIQDFSSESSTNVSYSDVDEPEVPFDKQHLKAQIEAGGGTVFDSWSDKFISKKTKSFIISSSYQRTIKYLQGLAVGIPCVSYLWIRDCCKQGISCDYKSYMLQAGISLKRKSFIECKLKPKCLDDTQVLVYSTNPDFIETWSEILTLAGCNVVKKFKKTRDQSREVDIVITDKTCSTHIKKQAEIYNTPLLSSEWVIQCLIHGQKLCYTAHEKFKFDYEE